MEIIAIFLGCLVILKLSRGAVKKEIELEKIKLQNSKSEEHTKLLELQEKFFKEKL